ncbi:hypothetical protein RvY_07403 [Ramazzottius varieornatus]|uniref:Uncharacterized protein n=1 Tax=Ramazzottius varieornatus TaxID=947166 RepID=A0A1D1V726_RAMVA|nr:hypothetical protein RvY_07403 [Ramazzottius varieornatus]
MLNCTWFYSLSLFGCEGLNFILCRIVLLTTEAKYVAKKECSTFRHVKSSLVCKDFKHNRRCRKTAPMNVRICCSLQKMRNLFSEIQNIMQPGSRLFCDPQKKFKLFITSKILFFPRSFEVSLIEDSEVYGRINIR